MPRIKAKSAVKNSRSVQKPVIKKVVKEKEITKKRVISELKKTARKLGRAPSSRMFYHHSGISRSQVAWLFQTYRDAVRAAGLQPNQMGMRVETAVLLEDWGRVAREVGRIPARDDYERSGSYSRRCFTGAFSVMG